MSHPTQDLDGWHLVEPSLMLKKLKGTLPRNPVSQWILHHGISPLDLYVYLRARFGKPNGFQMALKNQSSDNYVHWHWTLQYEDQVFHIMGLTLHAVAYIEGVPAPSSAEQEDFTTRIKAEFSKYGPTMSDVRRSLEKWAVFVNPFYRLRRVIDRFSERLASLQMDKIVLPGLPTTPEELKSLQEQWAACESKYTEALGLGTSIKMIAPVLAESFVNLLIFLLAKPEIPSDERLYNDTIRREIDLRIKTLHLTCKGFREPIDSAGIPFRNFLTVMNGRNDFLHGNINPLRLRYDTVYFDGVIPLPIRYQDMGELALVNSLVHVEPTNALADVGTVNDFIAFILHHLEADVMETVEVFMQTPNPGWREDTKRAGVLFPPHISHAVMGESIDQPASTDAG